eukprot:4268224-Lingulodinium_polyedra.AAC.1
MARRRGPRLPEGAPWTRATTACRMPLDAAYSLWVVLWPGQVDAAGGGREPSSHPASLAWMAT